MAITELALYQHTSPDEYAILMEYDVVSYKRQLRLEQATRVKEELLHSIRTLVFSSKQPKRYVSKEEYFILLAIPEFITCDKFTNPLPKEVGRYHGVSIFLREFKLKVFEERESPIYTDHREDK